jgi:hypothetical protein
MEVNKAAVEGAERVTRRDHHQHRLKHQLSQKQICYFKK